MPLSHTRPNLRTVCHVHPYDGDTRISAITPTLEDLTRQLDL